MFVNVDKSQYCDMRIFSKNKQSLFYNAEKYAQNNKTIVDSLLLNINSNKPVEVLNKDNIFSIHEGDKSITYNLFSYNSQISIV